MNKLIPIFILVFVLVFPVVALAQSNQQSQGKQDMVQDPTTHTENLATPPSNQVTNQNRIQTRNQAQDSQLQVATQHMEQLMSLEGFDEQIGSQVRALAQEQTQTQTQIQAQLNKLQSKSGFYKKLFGPDYKAIKNLKQQMEQNRLRIQQFQELQNQLANQAETNQLEEAIQALVEQNTNLEEQVRTEEQIRSLFGWLVKLFNK